MTSDALKKILEHVRQTAMLQSTMSMLEWDQNTGLPPSAAEYRADQLTLLAGMVHQRRVDPELGHWLDELIATVADQDPSSPPAVIARCMKREFDRCRKLPQRLVEELSYATSIGQQVWVESKLGDDYPRFMPQLTRIVELKRQEADCLASPGQSRYDVMLDSYEEGATTQEIRQIFLRLRESLVPMIQRASERSAKLGPSVLEGRFAIEPQERFSKWVAGQIGFDFQRGRLDQTEHPFCTTLGPHDHRILTRYSQESFSTGLYGVLHEAGHGMYEQGLDPQWYGTPVGSAASLGVHESQSRLWENLVGLAGPFWKWAYPHLLEVFPSEFRDVAPSRLVADLNRVQASLIRIEADEVTYNLHVMMRFDLERAVVQGTLPVRDLRDAWNERFEADFGIRPPSDAEGVLQDIHWSGGLVGYFPTYTLGNLFAAQLMAAAEESIPNLDGELAAGRFGDLLTWLHHKVHARGRLLESEALVVEATGRPVSERWLVESLRRRYGRAHGLA